MAAIQLIPARPKTVYPKTMIHQCLHHLAADIVAYVQIDKDHIGHGLFQPLLIDILHIPVQVLYDRGIHRLPWMMDQIMDDIIIKLRIFVSMAMNGLMKNTWRIIITRKHNITRSVIKSWEFPIFPQTGSSQRHKRPPAHLWKKTFEIGFMFPVNRNLYIFLRQIGKKLMIIKWMVHHNIDKQYIPGIKKRHAFRINKVFLPGTAVKIKTDRCCHPGLAKPDQIAQAPVLFALVKVKHFVSQQFKSLSHLFGEKPQGLNPLCK